MRTATLAAVVVGGAVFLLDLVLVPGPHDRDPFWWLAAAITVAGAALGGYVRRHDRRLPRARIDGAGVTAGVRALYALWEPADKR
jgi:hypothetical protein